MSVSDVLQVIRDFAAIELFTVGGTAVHASSVVTFVLILVATYFVSRVLQKVVAKTLVRAGISEVGTAATVRQLLHYFVMLGGLAVALQTIGIPVTSLVAAGAFLAVGIGFALQTILENFASGVILLGERSIEEGDVIELDGTLMRVERIGTRSTVTRTRDDDQRIIPNTMLVQSAVKNYTLGDAVYRVRAKVGVAYGSDMAVVELALREAALSVQGRLEDREPVVLLVDFGDSSVVWETSVWAGDPWVSPVTKSDLNKAIWSSLKKHGITIAFPQLDVHVNPSVDADE